jgi:hypothetical protein
MTPGFHAMDESAYHADPCPEPSLSSTIARVIIEKSPMHAFLAHPRLSPQPAEDDATERMDFGAAAHDILLEGGTGKIMLVDAEDWRTKAAREARDKARADGMVPVLPKQYDRIMAMVNAARAFVAKTELRGIWGDGEGERVMVWQEDGFWMRSRLDWITADRGLVLDYKTCESAQPDAFIRQLARMNYDMQAAFYRRGVTALTGKPPAWAFLAQETDAPYACSLVGMSESYWAIADAKVERAVGIWKRCMMSKNWMGYDTRIHYATPPTWVMAEHEANLQEGDE